MTEKSPPYRLTIEVGSGAQRILAERCEKEDLNASTIINRALMVYDIIMHITDTGGKIIAVEDGEMNWVRFT